MKKTLLDLTKDEWNTLFPIALEEHNPLWKQRFQEEKELLLSKIGSSKLLRIEHFGSSSIPTIKSKPYIDIIIEIPEALLFDEHLIAEFTMLGYTHFVVPEREGIAAYSSFGKGYHLDGKKSQIFHIHMCPIHNAMWEQLKFRDYLIANLTRAKAYEALKINLAAQFKNDRGAYVLGKTNFIKETLALLPKV
ncbi:GrpB family protein [Flavobacterium sp. ASW18X]|uniref:GrpB family protein n=1 Tax=Flavobacterium sp. ASW18X TaxID=2572595 RepID=UPI0010AE8185|nr:GrpB family protein [Flavobacterium sp. ASW18X]TKD66676.1 GrpB family protein [Flavobacterium sp. ASW18X]